VPDTAKVQTKYGYLPLYFVLCINASDDVINMKLEAYPNAVEVQTIGGRLPLHYALEKYASNNVIYMLFKAQCILVLWMNGSLLHWMEHNFCR
jgi:hypothetical protein